MKKFNIGSSLMLIPELISLHDIDLSNIKLSNKRQILRNAVLPELGKHIFDCAFKRKQEKLINY